MATFAELLDTIATENEFQSRLNQAKDAYRQQFGKDMPITSNVRTREQQEKLFKERASNPNLVAPPGTSKHEVGEAADIPTSVPESFLNQFGIHRPLGKKDPVHAVLMPAKQEAKTEPATESKTFADWVGSFGSGEVSAEPEKKQPSKVKSLVGDILMKGMEMRQQVPGFLASTADVIAGAPSFIAGTVGYGAGRLFGLSPEEATAASQKVAAPLAEPVGRVTGLKETEAYQKALPKQVMDYIGGHIEEGAKAIAQRFGVPEADVQNAINAAMIAAPVGISKAKTEFAKAKAELMPTTPSAAPVTPVKPGMVSGGAAAADVKAQIQEIAARLPENEARQLLAADPAKVDLAAAERRAVASKFGVELTKGEAKQDLSLLGDEFNAKKESPELQRRLVERSEKLFRGLDDIKERTAPDIYTADKTELGQRIIDTLQAKDAQRRSEISGLYKQLEDANAGALPIDTGTLLNNINTRLSQKMRSRYAPAELMDTIKDAAERKSMTFEEFENLRSIAAEEIRSSKDGNKRMAASIIRDELENMPLSTDNAQIKVLADQARAAAKARFDLLDKNPAYKAAVKDTRSAEDLAAGLESVSADKFLQQFVHSDTKQASTANLKRLMNELSDQPDALQALRAGTIEHFREKATMAGNNFGQAGYNKRLAALRGKVDRIFAGDAALQDLRDLGQLATWTEHRRPLTGANVSESGNVAIQGMKKMAEAGITAKTGVPVGAIKGYFQGKKRETELRKMIEPGAGLTND